MSEKIEHLIEKAQSAEKVYEREISCKIYRLDEGVLSIGSLVDQFHDISLILLVDPAEFTILDAQVKMDKVPYEICFETRADVEKLRGLFIFHPAVNREVRRAIKRREGCTHLFELIDFSLHTLFTGGPRAGVRGEEIRKIDDLLSPEEHRRLQIQNTRLKNTCRAFVLKK